MGSFRKPIAVCAPLARGFNSEPIVKDTPVTLSVTCLKKDHAAADHFLFCIYFIEIYRHSICVHWSTEVPLSSRTFIIYTVLPSQKQ